ncbi:hypothetical protein [Actinocrispum sp. NPDC049592]|uniref:hypothetical protein n=1 Tax=Actinocrispum sp. NPDC049592 TaxID=3154835 RepID=UPI003422299E
MSRTFRLLSGAALATAMIAGPGTMSAAAAACTWRPAALPLPAGGVSGVASATDNTGGFAGTVRLSDRTTHVVAWKNGKITDYGPSSSLLSVSVYDQNRAGTIVGVASLGRPGVPPASSGFRTNATKTESLPTPDGATSTFPRGGINDKGDIVGGYRTTRNGVSVIIGVRWRGNTVTELAGLPVSSNVEGLDEDGTVLYTAADRSPSEQRPFLWQEGRITALAKPSQAGDLRGYDISAGRVVGSLYYKNSAGKYVEEAIFWNTDGVPRKLPNGQSAVAINRDGVSAGIATNGQGAIWRLGVHEATLGAGTVANAVGDDGSVAGSRKVNGEDQPTVWRCS